MHPNAMPRDNCPACCRESTASGNECPWVTDMLEICGGLLFLGVSRDELAPFAPCRRAHRASAGATRAVVGHVATVPLRTHRHLRLV
jgi:hypothetical protein